MEQTSIFLTAAHFFTYKSAIFSGVAYIDPGSGSLLLQMLLAAFFASLFFVKSFLKKIKSFFLGNKKKTINKKSEK